MSTSPLTTGATDVPKGGAGDDTIIGQLGQSTTLQSSDNIDGGAGTDTFRIVSDAAAAQTATGFTVSNVETLEVQAQATGGTTLSLENVTGVATVRSSSSSQALTLDQVKSKVALEVAGSLGSPNLTVNYQAAVVSGLTDSQAIALNGNTLGTLTVAGVETLAISSNTAASTLAGVAGAALTSVTASGNQLVTVTAALPTTVKTVNASAQTAGGVVVTVGTVDLTATGGAGTDKVTFTAGSLNSNDAFNGGTGRDTVVAAVADLTANDLTTTTTTYGASAKLSNVEIVEFSTILPTTGFDASKIAGEDTYTFTAGYNTATMTGVSNATTLNLNLASAAATLTVPTATSLNLVIGSQGTATVPLNDGIGNMGTLVTAAATTLTLASNGVSASTDATKAVANTLAITAAAATGITVTGAEDTTLTLTGGALKTLDASAATGNNNFGAVTFASGATIMGGTGSDTITGSAGADVITGGTGNDSITAGNGADAITGGAGNDTFAYAALDNSSGTAIDTIADFVSGADKLSFTAAAAAAGRTTITLKGGAAANFGAAQAALALNSGVTQVVYQADTNTLWVDLNDDGTLNGNDLQIKLTGVTAVTSTDVGAVVGAASTAYTLTAGYDLFNATAATVANATPTALSSAPTLSASLGGTAGTAPTLNQSASVTTATANLTVIDTLAFGTATTDTLTFTDASTMTIAAGLVNAATVTGLDVIQLANAVNTITYTAVSTAAQTLKGGTSQDIITVAAAAGVTDIQAGAGGDVVTYTGTIGTANNKLDLGAGADIVTFSAVVDMTGMATVAGGADTDTIIFATAGITLADADFSKVSAVETVQYAAAGGDTAVLDVIALNAGVKKVVSTAGTNATTLGYTYGTTAAAGSFSVVGGTGADTLTVQSGVALTKVGQFAGGTGADVLAISQADTTLVDSMFAGVTAVETLTLTGASSVVLGANATTATLAAVTTGNGATSITSTMASNTVNANAIATTGVTLTLLGSSNYTTSSTNAGFDKLTATGSTGTISATFADTTSNAVTVAAGSGNMTIVGGAAGDTITVTGLAATQNFTGSVAKFVVTATAGAHSITGGVAADSITGGTGTDTITGGDGVDTLTGGTGADVFVYGASATDIVKYAGGDTTPANIEKITDFLAGTDTIRITTGSVFAGLTTALTTGFTVNESTLGVLSAAPIAITAGAADITALTARFETAASGVASTVGAAGAATGLQVYTFAVAGTSGTLLDGRTYLVINDGTAAIAATDVIIDITGVSGNIVAGSFLFG